MMMKVVFLAAFVVCSAAYNATLHTSPNAVEDHYIVVLQVSFRIWSLFLKSYLFRIPSV